MKMKAKENPTGDIVCCLACGKDTRNKTGYCHECVGCGAPIRESKDRGLIKTVHGRPMNEDVNIENPALAEYL